MAWDWSEIYDATVGSTLAVCLHVALSQQPFAQPSVLLEIDLSINDCQYWNDWNNYASVSLLMSQYNLLVV